MSHLPGVDCGENADVQRCSAAFEPGVSVLLQAVPGADETLVGWGGDPDCADGMVDMSQDRYCTAKFAATHIFSDDFEHGSPALWGVLSY